MRSSPYFLKFWSAYPLKVGKRKAEMKWRIAHKEIADDKGLTLPQAAEWLLERTKLFAQSDTGRSIYCPHPATWLFQGRYDDDIDAWGRNDSTQPTYRIPTTEEAKSHRF